MARQFQCDVCKKPTSEIVGKLMFTPLSRSSGANGFPGKYTHHLDVGVCCADNLLANLNWQQRKTKKEYNRSRRKSTPARGKS